ncbi:hypothetical protein [Nocardia vaccinii]|uniref:hypothetical protein n=1 Tax=Nocardia vaccinii TaxID=1822 RepID=UPI000A730EDE|nr:hypothetical protein [Nocardia vaccinii]
MAWYEPYENAHQRGARMHIRHAHSYEANWCEYCLQVHAVRAAELNSAPLSAMTGGSVQ